MATLSLCMIAKNEEAHIRRCLESVRGLVDEIVVVDTGSGDRTADIARSFGARVVPFDWQDDFSAARNASIEHATGDWILALDADESIAARDHRVIREQIERDDLDAVSVFQRSYMDTTVIGWEAGSGGYEEGQPYPGYLDVKIRRMFRRCSWLRFQNRVHEALLSFNADRPLRETSGPWVIHHFGKTGEKAVLTAKAEMYARIGAKKVEDLPLDPMSHYERGTACAELGRHDEALRCFERALELSPGFRDTELNIAICQARVGNHAGALATLAQAAQTLPDHAAEIAFEQGNIHRTRGDVARAEQAFRRALAVNPALAAASVNLALVLQRQSRPGEAIECLDAALGHAPSHRDLLTLRAHALRLRARMLVANRRFGEASACLAEIEASDADVESLRGAVALSMRKVDEAIGHLVKSLAEAPTGEAALNLSSAFAAQGNRPAALAALAEALRLQPEIPTAWIRFNQLTGLQLRAPMVPAAGRPLTFVFYQPRSIPFDARTPRLKGLGGTESAIVYLAESIARLGHRVIVLNNCEEPSVFGGVEYARWESLAARCLVDRPDVVVAVRAWDVIGRARLAPLQMFWTGDAYDQPFLTGLSDAHARGQIDVVMLQSDWQIETFREHHGIPDSQIARTALGTARSVHGDTRPQTSTPRARRLAYTSTPFRGLDVLLELFPRIRAACPDAELDVYSSMQVYGVSEADDEKQFGEVYRKAHQPGVNRIGSLPQPELARRLGDTRILAYPNHFPETFCIAAAEAQAAGCVVVTSRLGALPEVVGDGGVCIQGDPRSPEYQRAFVEQCISLLTDDEQWVAMSGRARARAHSTFSWPAIAGEWETLCRRLLGAGIDRKSA